MKNNTKKSIISFLIILIMLFNIMPIGALNAYALSDGYAVMFHDSEVDLGTVKPGYNSDDYVHTFTITNTGENSFYYQNTRLNLTGSGKDMFRTGINNNGMFSAGSTNDTAYYVRPVDGLETGTYTANVEFQVSEDSNETYETLETCTVTFTVSEHNFSSEWSSNTQYHWHDCLDTNCDVKDSFGEHDRDLIKSAYDPTFDDDGYTGDVYCSVCDRKMDDGIPIAAGKYIRNSTAIMTPATITAGSTPSDYTITSSEPEKYTVTRGNVWDLTASEQITDSTEFIKNHEYRIVVDFEAVDPYVYNETDEYHGSNFYLNEEELGTTMSVWYTTYRTYDVVCSDEAQPETCTVSFDLNGVYGFQPSDKVVNKGSLVTPPEEPWAYGYRFVAWYKEPECINIFEFELEPITKNTVLYAKWEEIEIQKINSVNVKINPPKVGDEVVKVKMHNDEYDFDYYYFEPVPDVILEDGANIGGEWYYISGYPSVMGEGYDEPFLGVFEENTDYYVEVYLYPLEGYEFADDVALTVDGVSEFELSEWNGANQLMFYTKIQATTEDNNEEEPINEIDITPYMFNSTYYADMYPDIKQAFGYNEEALRNHYYNYGIKEGRQASPVFNCKYYLENNEDVRNAFGENYEEVFNHFVNYGIKEGRVASKYFDVNYYLNHNNDVKTAFNGSKTQALAHFAANGINEGRMASSEFDVVDFYESCDKYTQNQLGREYVKYYALAEGAVVVINDPIDVRNVIFDSELYYSLYGDLQAAFGYNEEALRNHYYNYGIKEGRIGSYVFDVKYYLKNNEDVRNAFGENYEAAYNHFVNYGVNEGRKSSKFFDARYYIDQNEDLEVAFGSNYSKALNHFVNYGIYEGRIASEEFNVTVYREQNGDLETAFGNNWKAYYLHYINWGINEGRICV